MTAAIRRWGPRGLVLGLCGLLGGYVLWRATLPSAEQLAQSARVMLLRQQSAEAAQLSERALWLYPDSPAVRIAAAEVELDAGRREAALAHLLHVADDGSDDALHAVGSAGDLLFEAHRFSEAEARFRRVLQTNPDNVEAWRRLAVLLAIAGRESARNGYLEIVRRGKFDTHELALLGDPSQVYDNPEFVAHFREPRPDDPLLELGAARYALYRHEASKAIELYRGLLARLPGDVDLLAGLGRALCDAGDETERADWLSQLPASADEHAEIWAVRGRMAFQRNQPEIAIRCFAEAVRLDPNHLLANQNLSMLLYRKGEETLARRLSQRADQLKKLNETLAILHLDSTHLEYLLAAAELCVALERPWEAWGWHQVAADRTRRSDLRDKARHLYESLTPETPQTLASANPLADFDFARYPLPDRNNALKGNVPERPAHRKSMSTSPNPIRFVDRAAAAGLEFTYHNGDDPQEPGMRIFESSGGGVAVLDFDSDGWPDIHFTQGCDWPPVAGQTAYRDQLFRNCGNGRFVNVTLSAGIADDRYSQGVTSGDLDSDGFADLYVANIGQNRLYRNNGDGTFTDSTASAGIAAETWSTSILLADLNGDAFPEIYDVTYVAGRTPFEHICHDKQNNNAPRVCSPGAFEAENDRLYLNRGDGTFAHVTRASGILAPQGKGLGILTGDFDGSGRLSLYVANDTTANFLFLSQLKQFGESPTFVEQALLAGCALDSEGKAQASMGIAADDADGDGLLDLYITNFYQEYNALYVQQPGGTFLDRTSESRLKEPSLSTLGFGTQFIDANLDGWPDLVAANGHVDDYSAYGIPFRMRAQFFINEGHGRFQEIPPAQLGDYFQLELLGRSLARIDWNRDGREDFVVSNLDTPAALVTNDSPRTGHFLALQLRGVQSNRDAIGTKVEIVVGGRRIYKHLTAGDGYQCSNQRQIVVGLGSATKIEELVLRWPSGTVQTFEAVAADRELLAIECRDQLLALPDR